MDSQSPPNPSSPVEPAAEPGDAAAPATVLHGRFEVVRQLGHGGGGRVRLVRDGRRGGELRVLKTARADDPEGRAAAIVGLLHEARVLNALVHRGVPRLEDLGVGSDGLPWLLMGYVEPQIETEAEDPVHVAHGLLDVLGYLHRHGWLHLDLKPANVVVSARRRVVLLDYGLAVRQGVAVPPRGTLPYVAPEVLRGESPDQRSDLWSLGAVLLQLVLGRQLEPAAVLGPDDVPDDTDADLPLPREWLQCLLRPRRERRFETAEAALAELATALGSAPMRVAPRPLAHAPNPAGRGAEIETLVGALQDAKSAPEAEPEEATARAFPGLHLLRGESGVGKSSLLFELRLRATELGWASYSASCAEERDAPLPALGTLLDAVLQETPADSPALERRGAQVANLLAARGDRSGAETAARFLSERAREGSGVLLVVEDLQNASAMTLRVMGAVARAVSEVHGEGKASRLLVVASLTDGIPLAEDIAEAVDVLTAEGIARALPLRPLGREGVDALVRGVLGPNAPVERVAEIVHANGGALPLFAEELLRQFVRERALRHDAGRWFVDTKVAPRLPENLADAVQARLNGLPARELRAVQLLATRELPLRVDRASRLLGEDADEILAELAARGLVGPAGGGRGVALVHAIIGATALSMVSAARRMKLHDAVARSVPQVDASGELRRAYHVARGSNPDAGFQAATTAARRLRSDGEPGRAAQFVRQALRLLPDDDPRIPYVRQSMAELLVASGRPTAASNVYRDLLAAEADDVQRVQLRIGLAEALGAAGKESDVVPVCRDALGLIDRLGDSIGSAEADDLRLSVLARLSSAQRAIGDLHPAIETVKQALPLAGDGRGAERAALLTLLGNVYAQMGDLKRARQFHEHCIAVCRGLGRRRGVATALHNLGASYAREGNRAASARSYRQSLRMSRRARDLLGVAQTLGNMANLRAEEGDFGAAEKLQRRSLVVRRRIGDLAGIAVTHGNLAGIFRARGRLGAALALLETATRRLRALGDVEGEVQFLLQAASIHLLAGDSNGSRPLLARATSRARAASLRGLESSAEVLLGRLERRLDPKDEMCMTHLRRAVELAEAVGDRHALAEAYLETALAESGRGRRGSAMRAWRAASDLLGDGSHPDVRARADLVRGRLDHGREPSEEAVEALRRFHAYAHASGRRDYRVAAAYALARALHLVGEIDDARVLVAEALRADDDLAASLPPGLRRVRESGPARERLLALKEELDAGAATQADDEPAGEDMDQDRLFKLLEINKLLAQAKDVRALLDTIMDVATDATGAERGFLIIVDDGKISFQTARNFKREEVATPELKVSRTLVKRVMRSGQPVLTDNATEDQRFAEFESVERLELKSICSIPFRSGDDVIGALYLDNPARKGAFGPGDLQFLSALGDQAALAIENLRHAEQMKSLNAQLEANLEKKSAELEQASRALADRATKYPYPEIVGQSPQIRQVLLLVDKVVEAEVPVLIQGESGTGKELIARAIHANGRRKDGPFVTVNCGAIAETLMESELFGHKKGAFTGAHQDNPGLFQAAHGGTIFLDEIGEMNFDMQKKLLRVLQEREVRPVGGEVVSGLDVRVLTATNRDLRKMMAEHTFREDLYYRIAVINIDLPPLRDRVGDIPVLVEFLIARAVKELGLPMKPFDDEAVHAMAAYAWPGNVRELENEVKKALTLSDDRVTLEDLSVSIQGDRAGPEPELVRPEEGATLKENLAKMERALIEKALERTGGNQTQAAKDLGISRVWLRKKMEKHGLFDR